MVRRSFRFGLLVGLLGGAAFAAMKVMQARRSRDSVAEPWEPIVERGRPETATPASSPTPSPTAATGTGAIPAKPATPAPRPDTSVAQEAAAPASKAPAAKNAAKKQAKKDAGPDGPTHADLPPRASTGKAAPSGRLWVEPSEGECPPSHPVKAKATSKIFHLPGMFAYNRTRPDRCYADAEGASADGFTQAKR